MIEPLVTDISAFNQRQFGHIAMYLHEAACEMRRASDNETFQGMLRLEVCALSVAKAAQSQLVDLAVAMLC